MGAADPVRRVLQAIAGGEHGGAEIFFTRLVIALHRAGVAQRVLIRPYPGRQEELAAAGIDVVSLPFGSLFDLSTSKRFRAEIGEFRPDAVLTWMNRATKACPRHRPGDSFAHVGSPRGYYNIKYYRHCDFLLCTTEDVGAYFTRQGWPADRIGRIQNFAPDIRMAPQSRASLDTPEKVPLLLALGRLHVNKGFDVLLQAMTRLPDHWLWLGGTGPLEKDLKEQARNFGVAPRVRFLGWREDTPALFAAADIFVCSSHHEPFGNVVIEAWAQGVPVVAAASQGPGALIQPEVSGLLVAVNDPWALAGAIRKISSDADLAQRLAAGGRAAYEADHTEAIVIARYLDFFAKVARR